jgi:hypothetical protein
MSINEIYSSNDDDDSDVDSQELKDDVAALSFPKEKKKGKKKVSMFKKKA